MNQLFLCYRRAGVQTAKLFKFYMSRNHPEIRVWYSDLENEGNYTLDIPNLIRMSYGAVIFITKDFTKGFLDKNGQINSNSLRDNQNEECVTVREIIEIEKNIQERKDFELHTVNLDGAVLGRKEQKVIEAVFRQAGIWKSDSIAHFAQRNFNSFDTARENEDRFFSRMISAYMPNNIQQSICGNYSIGVYTTTVDILCWDCERFILPENVSFGIETEGIALYDQIEAVPLQEELPKQDDDVLSVVRFDQGLTSNEENKYIHLSCMISKYHLFKKALDLWDKNSFNMSAEISHYLNGEEEQRRYTIPNAMGLAIMVVTADEKLVFSRRSSKRRVRSNEFDCSIVEGLLPRVSKKIGGVYTEYSYLAPDYLMLECKRAFYEEICVDDFLSVNIFGLILDRKYGQWNFAGMIRSSLTAEQIMKLHSTRDDTTEVNRLFFVDYLKPDGERDLASIKKNLTLYRTDGLWDTALTVLTGALRILGFSLEEINKLSE